MARILDAVRRGRSHTAPMVLRGHNGAISFVAFLSDDQIISSSNDDKTIRRWSLPKGPNEVFMQGVPCAVAASPNRRWVAIGGRDHNVKLYNLGALGDPMISDRKHADTIKSFSFSPDSSQLASGAQDGVILVWSTTTLKQVAGPFKGHKDAVWSICYSPDGKRIASCDRETIQIWDTASTTWVGLTISEPAWSLAWFPDGGSLFAGCIDGTVRRYDPDTGAFLTSYTGHSDVVFSIKLSHNAKFFATASWDKTARLWEAATFQQCGPVLQHDDQVHSISLSADDGLLVSGARDSNIRVWSLRVIAPDLFRVFPFPPNRGPIQTPIYSPFWSKVVPESRVNGGHGHPHIHDTTRITGGWSEESFGNTSLNSGSKVSLNTEDIIYISRAASVTSGYPQTPSPTTQESSSPQESLKSPSSSFLSVPTHSPIERLKRRVSESDNKSFISEIRTNPTHDLTGIIVPEGRNPVSGGSHGDIYRGTLNLNGRNMRVAIKVMKKYTVQGDDESKKRRLNREIKFWVKFNHRNVISLLGTTKDYGDFPAMVCPWVENGTLAEYLERRHTSLTTQLRLCLINDVALGIQYLHSQAIVHGDISGTNVLVYASGRACIAGFGLSFFENRIAASSAASTYHVKETVRWTAPELLNFESDEQSVSKVFPTMESDIYSFGGVMFHVLSGQPPYHNLPRDEMVVFAISQGRRPSRPPNVITDDQWAFMVKCWSFEPLKRPLDLDVVTFVHEQLLDAVAATSCELP